MDSVDTISHLNYNERFRIINNGLAIPEYRKFLKDNGLEFLTSGTPQDKEAKQFSRIIKLHEKCFNVFNNTVKRYHHFRGKIVSFRYISHNDLSFDEWTIEEFLEHAENTVVKLRTIERKGKIYKAVNIVFLLLLILCGYLVARLATEGNNTLYFLPVMLVGIGGIYIYMMEIFVNWYSEGKIKRITRKEIAKIKNQIARAGGQVCS